MASSSTASWPIGDRRQASWSHTGSTHFWTAAKVHNQLLQQGTAVGYRIIQRRWRYILLKKYWRIWHNQVKWHEKCLCEISTFYSSWDSNRSETARLTVWQTERQRDGRLYVEHSKTGVSCEVRLWRKIYMNNKHATEKIPKRSSVNYNDATNSTLKLLQILSVFSFRCIAVFSMQCWRRISE